MLANYTLTEPTAVAFFSTITIAWNHRLSEWSTMSLSAGDAYTDSTGLDGAHYSGFLPVAGVTLTLTKARPLAGGRLSATFASKMAPMIDRLSGSVVQVLTTSAGAMWTRRRLTLQVMGFGATAIGNQSQAVVTSNYGVSESATYHLDRRHWTVTAGSRQAYQRFSSATEPPLLWGAFISISYMTSVGTSLAGLGNANASAAMAPTAHLALLGFQYNKFAKILQSKWLQLRRLVDYSGKEVAKRPR